MTRDPETIQREIERTRDALADNMDALIDRANPKRLVDSGKQQLQAKLDDPRIRYVLLGVGALVALSLLRKMFR